MTDERAGENFDLVRAIIAQASCNEGMTLNAGDVAFLAKVMESTPAPSIVTGSDGRAREVSATLLGEVMQDAWGEICDDADAHPSDMKHGEGTVLFYSPGHWTHLIALRLNERLAALAASRPTDGGAATLEMKQAALDASRQSDPPFLPVNCELWAAEMTWNAMVAERTAALATPKPPVDEAMREMASAPRDGTYILAVVAPGRGRYLEHQAGRAFVIRHEGNAGDYDMGWAVYPGFGGCSDHDFSGWFPLPAALRNLTGDGAGA